MRVFAWCSLLAVALLTPGCGGGQPSPIRSCGPTFATPNYTRDTDPGTNRVNRTLIWPSFPVTYKIENDVVLSGTSTSGLARQAVAAWVAGTGGRLRMTEVPASSRADISFRMAQISSVPGAGQTLGVTSVTFDPSTLTLFEARITVNYWPGMTASQINQGLLSTIKHEFGHALFLNGHSETTEDLMYFQGDISMLKPLTQKDINSLETAYCGDFTNRGTRARPDQLVTVEIQCQRRFTWTKS